MPCPTPPAPVTRTLLLIPSTRAEPPCHTLRRQLPPGTLLGLRAQVWNPDGFQLCGPGQGMAGCLSFLTDKQGDENMSVH